MEADEKRQVFVAAIDAAKAEVIELEHGRDELMRIEHELTTKIATAPPIETVDARTRRVAVLEATGDTVRLVEAATERIERCEQQLAVHDATVERAELVAAYDKLRDIVRAELKVLHPRLVQMDACVARIGWLEKAVIRVNGDMTNSYFSRPSGVIAFDRSGIDLQEVTYAEKPGGLEG